MSNGIHPPGGHAPASSPRNTVRDALRIRRWALRSLFTNDSPDWCGGGIAGWHLFLKAELCALPLRERLNLSHTPLPPAHADVLGRNALREQQRAMSARAQLRELDLVAASYAGEIVLIKGGISIALGRHADLGDLDLITQPAHAGALILLLQRSGYSIQRIPNHFAVASRPGELRIDIHTAANPNSPPNGTKALERATIPGYDYLTRLAGTDHLVQLLRHLRKHPHRYGHLRDLLVLGDAISELAAERVADVRAIMLAERDATGAAMLEMAAELAGARDSGSDPAHYPEDRFLATAAAKYLFVSSGSRLAGLAPRAMTASAGLLNGWRTLRPLLPIVYFSVHVHPGARPYSRQLAKLSKRAAGAVAVATRWCVGLLAIATGATYALCAWWIAWRSRADRPDPAPPRIAASRVPSA